MRKLIIGFANEPPLFQFDVDALDIQNDAAPLDTAYTRKIDISYDYSDRKLSIVNGIKIIGSESNPLPDIRYCLYGANKAGGFDRSPSGVVRSLGIVFESCDASAASFADVVIFRGCRNIPKTLPSFIKVIEG